MTELLERFDAESQLHQSLARARNGQGGIALVAGEAGIGKTSLVAGFLSRAAGRLRVLFGACDPLETPRPLGPLIDATADVDPDLATRLAARCRARRRSQQRRSSSNRTGAAGMPRHRGFPPLGRGRLSTAAGRLRE